MSQISCDLYKVVQRFETDSQRAIIVKPINSDDKDNKTFPIGEDLFNSIGVGDVVENVWRIKPQ